MPQGEFDISTPEGRAQRIEFQLNLVRQYYALGFRVIRLYYKTKKPVESNWTGLWDDLATLEEKFSDQPYNIGCAMGRQHDNRYLVDADLDAIQCVKLATWTLPDSGFRYGRRSKPNSHYFYYIDGEINSIDNQDPQPAPDEKSTLNELRSTGLQTMLPGSIHPDTGELIVFEVGVSQEPSEVEKTHLIKKVNLNAGIGLLSRKWRLVARHWTTLYLAAGLMKSGWQELWVSNLFSTMFDSGAVLDEESSDRFRAVADTARRIEEEEQVAGWPSLKEQLGVEVVKRFCQLVDVAIQGDRYHLSDEGNAQRLYARFGSVLRYCPQMEFWFIWDGRRWERDTREQIVAMCRETVRRIGEEALEEPDPEKATQIAKWGAQSHNGNRILMIPKLARTMTEMLIPVDKLDAQAHLLNCPNGTVNLQTMQMYPHRREDYLTKMSGVEYDASARSLMWEHYLNQAMRGNQEMVKYLQRAAGYTATGETGEDCFFLAWGPTRTGKSTFLNAQRVILGDYGQTTRAEVFMTHMGDTIPHELAELQGARGSFTTETEVGQQFATALMKQLSGGDRVQARFLYKGDFEYKPCFKVWIATNNRPVLSGSDGAIWERLRLIPFTNQFIGDDQDKTFRDRLPVEAGKAILAWIVQGAHEWYRNGLGTPPEVTQATRAYRDEMDSVAHFIEDACETDEFARVPAAQLWNEYQNWCRRTNTRGIGMTEFKDDMTNRGYQQRRTGQGMVWEGVQLRRPQMIDDISPTSTFSPFGTPQA